VSGKDFTFNPPRGEHDESYITQFYRHIEKDGRRYRLHQVERNEALGIRKNLIYEYNNYTPKLGWMMELVKLKELDKQGKLVWSSNGRPSRKIYLDEVEKPPIGNLWSDIPPIQAQSDERLGYPTQKPLALLERIVKASSNENDIVLDAFCGCGTALEAAQRLKRNWIGIDVSPTACRVMAQRLKKNCAMSENEDLWRAGRGFIVRDTAWTEGKLREMPPFEFENWAVITLGGKPNKVQVGDMGIDGRIFPIHAMPGQRGAAAGELEFTDIWFPIQVKQVDKVGRPDIDKFEAVMIRERRTLGYFVGFDFSKDALDEIAGFQKRQGLTIKPLTVRELLEN
jgi:SAM-dependent methyltransferase